MQVIEVRRNLGENILPCKTVGRIVGNCLVKVDAGLVSTSTFRVDVRVVERVGGAIVEEWTGFSQSRGHEGQSKTEKRFDLHVC